MATTTTRSLITWLAAALSVGCTSVSSPQTVNLLDKTVQTGTAGIVSDKGGALISDKGGTLVSDKGGSLISNNSGQLKGVIQGPSAQVLANLVSNNAGSLVSPSGGTLIGNNAAGFRIAALDGLLAPGAGAEVTVVDAEGNVVSESPVVADAQGRYTIGHLRPSGPVLFVKATYKAGDKPVTLVATAQAPREAVDIEASVDPASTVVGRKVGALLKSATLTQDQVGVEALHRIADRVAEDLSASDVATAALGSEKDAEAVFDHKLASDSTLRDAVGAIAGPAGAALTKPTTPVGPTEVSLLAGSGQAGLADGQGAKASFQYPYSVAADAAGHVYVADFRNNCIRRVDPDGTVVTLAGNPTAGYADGKGSAASFSGPRGITVDVVGNVLVVDAGNACIRKVTPDGTVTTLAGNGKAGYIDGDALEAEFNDPRGITTDAQGAVYVADTGNYRIRKLGADNKVTTVAQLADADSPARPSDAKLSGPYGLVADEKGRLFIADTTTNTIQMLDTNGTLTPFAGSGAWGDADGSAKQASFRSPVALALGANGSLYVADCFNHCVRTVDADGKVTTLAGDGTVGSIDGDRLHSRFYGPYGLTLLGDNRLVVADTSNQVLRTVTLP